MDVKVEPLRKFIQFRQTVDGEKMKKTWKVNKLSIFVFAAYFQFLFYITNSNLKAVRLE